MDEYAMETQEMYSWLIHNSATMPKKLLDICEQYLEERFLESMENRKKILLEQEVENHPQIDPAPEAENPENHEPDTEADVWRQTPVDHLACRCAICKARRESRLS